MALRHEKLTRHAPGNKKNLRGKPGSAAPYLGNNKVNTTRAAQPSGPPGGESAQYFTPAPMLTG
ncbi:hypothetical protein [Jhaorihella thermophila]|uniref:Uncharacterized protein n=1 Tax=Jhaorihella thermophila TaxID=488547 RepID=A0A1H5VS78_9RHOB|nr:hypothetical protein [Jhaorihella thermophila]SEF89866.1 hypothetical protein SAMN05421751_106195 [Jhaorihella thermophila]